MGTGAGIVIGQLHNVGINDPQLSDSIISAATKVVGADKVQEMPLTMTAEDFSFYTLYKPGAMFWLGAMPTDGNCAPLHNGKMTVNEDILNVAPNIFIQFVLDNM